LSKIVAAILADGAKAQEGNLALKRLAAEGVEGHAFAIITKGADTKPSVREDSHDGFRVTAAGKHVESTCLNCRPVLSVRPARHPNSSRWRALATDNRGQFGEFSNSRHLVTSVW
jgi:hypothetical protein